jgi:hypothetical protein
MVLAAFPILAVSIDRAATDDCGGAHTLDGSNEVPPPMAVHRPTGWRELSIRHG